MIELKVMYVTKGIVINSINPQNSLKIDAKNDVHSMVIINVMRTIFLFGKIIMV